MRRLGLLLSYLLISLGYALIEIVSPPFGSIFVTIPPSATVGVSVEFRIQNDEIDPSLSSGSLVCMTLFTSDKVLFQNQCVPKVNNFLKLNNIEPGKYTLEMTLFLNNQPITDGQSQTQFEVVMMENALPTLKGPSDLGFLANSQTDASDATFLFSLSDSSLNKYLHVCVEVIPIALATFGLERSCLSSDQNRVTLYNIPSGTYQLILELQLASQPYTSFASSRTVSALHVYRLQEILPSLHLDQTVLEYGIAATELVSNEISLGISTVLHPSFSNPALLSHFDTCLNLNLVSEDSSEPATLCAVTTPYQQFSLRHLPRGSHSYSVSLRSHHQPTVTFPQSQVDGQILVQNMTEFIPSYDWRELKPWHTIPSGLETRLPVGSGARKEARIPQPWRLQTSMPRPCKYFLRMDISRSTTVGQIRSAAAAKCQKPLDCFQILIGGDEIDDDSITSEGINLFSQSVELNYISGEVCDLPEG